jgi:hypothetical protein
MSSHSDESSPIFWHHTAALDHSAWLYIDSSLTLKYWINHVVFSQNSGKNKNIIDEDSMWSFFEWRQNIVCLYMYCHR